MLSSRHSVPAPAVLKPYVRRLTVSLTADEFEMVQAVVRELAASGRPVSYADAVRECVRRAVT